MPLPPQGRRESWVTLDPHLPLPDVFKNALRLGTFSAVLVTYAASALLHVSRGRGSGWELDGGGRAFSSLTSLPPGAPPGLQLPSGCGAAVAGIYHLRGAR